MLQTERNDKMVTCNNCGNSINSSKQFCIKLEVRHRIIYFCCKDCLDEWLKDTTNYFEFIGW